jgi:hypothetical protein
MSNHSLVEQIRQALDRGQAVVIAPPGGTTPGRAANASLAMTLCKTFGLSRSEARMLAHLLNNDYGSDEELCAAAFIAKGSLRVVMVLLRRKMRPHGIEITVTYKVGYSIDRKSRDRIFELLAAQESSPERAKARSKLQEQSELIVEE